MFLDPIIPLFGTWSESPYISAPGKDNLKIKPNLWHSLLQ